MKTMRESTSNELEQKTEEFERILTTLSNGDGLMEEDIEYLAKQYYRVEHPYE